MNFKQELEKLRTDFVASIKTITNPTELEKFKNDMLGRNGALAHVMKELKNVAEAERPALGKLANEIKNDLQEKFDHVAKRFSGLGKDPLDPSLPGLPVSAGHLHPLTIVRNDIERIFQSMGFTVDDGDQLVSDYDNFESLNIPPDHPAREMQDTFFIRPKKGEQPSHVLRTHTSAMQVRIMKRKKPPIRSVVIGRVFRNEATDASHEHTFHQVEGVVVGEDITIGHLKYTLRELYSRILQQEIRIRLRPSYFPFVEPGFELDISCLNCQERGCPVCKRVGWVEMLGCGMIHPKVFEHAGYELGKYTGFAFGGGIDRLAMMRYGIEDVRHFHSNDVRFLEQF